MTHKAPHVYIAGRRMDDFAASTNPVLAGMTLDFGVESDLDFPDGDTATLDMAVREDAFLDFLQLGEEVAVYHEPPAGAAVDDVEFTYFTGRIQRLTGDPHPDIEGALLLHIECSDLTADLASLEVFEVNSAEADGAARIGHLNYWLPSPWTLAGWVRWPDLLHAPLHYARATFLDMVDAFARGQLLRRRNASTFSPRTGITRRIHLMEDSTKDTRADKLTFFGTSKRWGVVPGMPYGPDVVVVNVEASDLHRNAGWVKEPEDVITEVQLELVEDGDWNAEESRWEDSATFQYSSNDFPQLNTAAMKARYGTRKATFSTDLGRKTTSTHLVPIMRHWLSTASEWRPSALSFHTTENLNVHAIRRFLGVHNRFSTFLIVRNPTPHRPDAGNQLIRGFVIGGSATWTGKTWDLSLRLGRNPEVTAGLGDWWTLERLAASPDFQNATCDNVGGALSVRDFQRIGEPI